MAGALVLADFNHPGIDKDHKSEWVCWGLAETIFTISAVWPQLP
jgi:hypothetical protein